MGFSYARPQPREATELVRQGYERNPIVFRSVRMIAESVASVPWILYVQGQERADHPLAHVLRAPGGFRSGVELLEILVTNLFVYFYYHPRCD